MVRSRHLTVSTVLTGILACALLTNAGCIYLSRIPNLWGSGTHYAQPVIDFVVQQYTKQKATPAEKQRAAREAETAQTKLTPEQRQQMDASKTRMAVRANDTDGWMVMDAQTGKPKSDKVYTVPENQVPPKEVASNTGTSGTKPAVARLDDYDVVFVN